MSERTRAESGLRSTADVGPSPEDVRRKLEGRVEVVEGARAPYAALEALLKGRRWKHRLRQESRAVGAVLAGEATLVEALERIRRRAEVEGWPEETPVLATVREVSTLRARLEALVRQRLGTLVPPKGEPSLGADLPRLVEVLSRPLPVEPTPGEVRLLDATKQDPSGGPLSSVNYVFLAVFLLIQFLPKAYAQLVVYAAAGMGLVLLVAYLLKSGEYWLTSERLVWKPRVGEPVEVPLRSIPAGGVNLQRLTSTVWVEGERTVRMPFVPNAELLTALLELHRQAPLLGASRSGMRLEAVSVYSATLREGGEASNVWVVLRPGYVAFLPREEGLAAVRGVVGAPLTPGLRIEMEAVLEQLRWLPEEEFDAAVARAVAAAGGERWSALDARYRAEVPVWSEIRLTNGAKVLSGKVDWSQQARAEKVLAFWAR